MTGALALLSAAAVLGGLPQLPDRGLALETKAGVQLQTMAGKPIATLPLRSTGRDTGNVQLGLPAVTPSSRSGLQSAKFPLLTS